MEQVQARVSHESVGLNQIELFFLLQFLDFMTTLIGLRLGGSELSPFTNWMMSFDVVGGLGAVKLLGFSLGAACLMLKRQRVIAWINVYFAVVVVWNLQNILSAVS
jgi:hypothetical protein